MTAAIKYLGQKTDEIFATQMERAAHRICKHQDLFPHHQPCR
jgi:hypothetical protein